MKTGLALPLLALLTALSPYTVTYAADALKITNSRVREAPPTARVLAAYMSMENTGDSTITIHGISSPEFESAELHRTIIKDGIARMQPVGQLDIPENAFIKLEPGGLHLMLINPKRSLAAGDVVTLTVQQDNAPDITIQAPVVRQDDTNHTHQHH